MSINQRSISIGSVLESQLEAARRHTCVSVIRRNPKWTIGQLANFLVKGREGKTIEQITIGELLGFTAHRPRPSAVEIAKASTGADFDRIVLSVITEAGRWVGARYLHERVGGPRWKRQASLARLVEAKLVERRGTTSATVYRQAQR